MVSRLPDFSPGAGKPLLPGSSSPSSPGASERPRRVDVFQSEYTILRTLDRGSFGIVNLVCLKASPSKAYACKQLSLSRLNPNLIKNEVDIIRKARHQHIVEIVDELIDGEEDFYHIVMAPAADCDLAKYIRRKIQAPGSQPSQSDFGPQRLRLVQWMHCLANAVQHIHGLGIRHRDIKPENILVHGENILLTDFGTSFYSIEDTRYTSTSTLGTAKYLPPEAAECRRFGRCGDIFSLGCVFWEMTETLSSPLVGNSKFPRIHGTYSDFVGGPGNLDQILHVKENATLKKRYLAEGFRFSDRFLESLLLLVFEMLNPKPQGRHTAKEVVTCLVSVLDETESESLPCCIPFLNQPSTTTLNLAGMQGRGESLTPVAVVEKLIAFVDDTNWSPEFPLRIRQSLAKLELQLERENYSHLRDSLYTCPNSPIKGRRVMEAVQMANQLAVVFSTSTLDMNVENRVLEEFIRVLMGQYDDLGEVPWRGLGSFGFRFS
jgi:serine/threonine protein kinase